MTRKKRVIEEIDIPEFRASIENISEDSRIFVDKSLEIVHYIHYVMDRKGLKQKDLAQSMGKSEAELSKILGGMHNLTLRSISKLEAALQATIVCTPNIRHLAYGQYEQPVSGHSSNTVTQISNPLWKPDYNQTAESLSFSTKKEKQPEVQVA